MIRLWIVSVSGHRRRVEDVYMMDKINRIFAALVRPHWIWYWLVFLIIGLTVFAIAPPPKTRMDFINKDFYYFVIFPCIFLCGFFCRAFYTYEELNAIAKSRRLGYPNTDNYFYTKITSDIDTSKKLFGYVYVLTKLTSWIAGGYLMGIGFYSQFILGK